MKDITERTFKFALTIVMLFGKLNKEYRRDTTKCNRRSVKRIGGIKENRGSNRCFVKEMTF